MKYIVDSKEVSRDTFYFCKKAKEENKTFVLLNIYKDTDSYINKHPEYDYYIFDKSTSYLVKGEKTVKEWLERGLLTCTIDAMTKRYNISKFKDILTLEEWYTKNGWVYQNETTYRTDCFDIPKVKEFNEEPVQSKLFSVIVTNNTTVQSLNALRAEHGNFSIKYVLRDNNFTEIIYEDTYKEI